MHRAQSFYARSDRPTALVTLYDLVASSFMIGFIACGGKVPSDLSILTYNNGTVAASAVVPLTAIGSPARQFSDEIMGLMDRGLAARKRGKPFAEHVVLPAKLVVRASTGPGAAEELLEESDMNKRASTPLIAALTLLMATTAMRTGRPGLSPPPRTSQPIPRAAPIDSTRRFTSCKDEVCTRPSGKAVCRRPGIRKTFMGKETTVLTMYSVFFVGAVAGALGGVQMTLVESGATTCTIVIPKDASATEALAAGELQRYLKEATGVEMPLVTDGAPVAAGRILVATSEHAPKSLGIDRDVLGDEGFAIKTVGDDLYMIGSRDRSCLYAVYNFLYDVVGVRFYCYDDERVPKLDRLQIGPIDRIDKPDFTYRGLKGWNPVGVQFHWMAKMGYNYIQTGLKGFVKRPERYSPFVRDVKKWDMIFDLGGHYVLKVLPPEKYFKDHPEWYSLIIPENKIGEMDDDYYGKRYDTSAGKREPRQICSSSPEAVEEFVKNFMDMVKKYPDADIYAAWYSDGLTFCQCPRCIRKQNWLWINEHPSCKHWAKPYWIVGTKQLLQAMNPLAEAMSKEFPEKKLFSIAYVNTSPAPRELQPNPHLNMQYAFWHRCYSGSIDQRGDANCDDCNEYVDQNLQKWIDTCKGDVIIYYYAGAKGSMDGRFMPFPHVIAGDIKHLKTIGAEGVLSQHAWPWAFNLNVYTLGRMLWNAGLTADAIIDEYCHRYGPAAGEMKQYTACMEQAMAGLHHPEALGDNWTGPPPERMKKMTAAMKRMTDAGTHLKKAATLATDDLDAKAVARDQALYEWTYRSFEIWTEYAHARLYLDQGKTDQAQASYARIVTLSDALNKDVKELDIDQNIAHTYRFCRKDLASRGLEKKGVDNK